MIHNKNKKPKWARVLSQKEFEFFIKTITKNLELNQAEFSINQAGMLDVKFHNNETVTVFLERWINIFKVYGKGYFPSFVNKFIKISENINNPNSKI